MKKLFAYSRVCVHVMSLRCIRIYQLCIRPLLSGHCRYVPTCSEYMQEAIRRYGVFKGVKKGCLRLLRCHPFVKGGHDPVA